jgi:hypothetical protein
MAEDRTRQTAAKLHAAGPNILDRDIRLDLLGHAGFGSGPSLSKESDADLSGVERVEVVATASRTGTGRDQPRCAVVGKWRYS